MAAPFFAFVQALGGFTTMNMPRLVSLLLVSTALAFPALATAQEAPAPVEATVDDGDDILNQDEEATEISVPGGEILVTGRRDRNITRAAAQVVSVLSTRKSREPAKATLPALSHA